MEYLFFISEATSKKHLWLYKDIEKERNVSFVSPWGGNNSFIKLIRLLLIKIGKIIKFDIVKSINSRRFRIKQNRQYCVVVEAGYLAMCKKDFYNNLRKHCNVKVFLLLVDAMSAHSPSLQSVKEQVLSNDWDEVFTFEKDDADKYGWNYSGINCSSLPVKKNTRISYDVYFVGGLKGKRSNLLFPVYDYLVRNGISCQYDLWYQSKSERNDAISNIQSLSDGFNKSNTFDIGTIKLRKHFLKYKKVLKKVQETNVIFEVVQDGQSTPTMRWFEAIYYNKKLITNNPNIKNFPFYNERFMKCIDCPEDIDISWILGKDIIDYRYAGEISPIHLLAKIREKAEC